MPPKEKLDHELFTNLNSNICRLCDILEPISIAISRFPELSDGLRSLNEAVTSGFSQLHSDFSNIQTSIDPPLTHTSGSSTRGPDTASSMSLGINQELEQRKIQETIQNEKSKISDWSNALKIRYNHYMKYTRNITMSELYNNYCTPSVDNDYNIGKFLPRKFRIKFIQNEPTDESNLRLQLAFQNMKTESMLMEKHSVINFNSFKNVDSKMNDSIKTFSAGPIGVELCKLWADECQQGEQKVIEIWRKKREWFTNNELDVDFYKYPKGHPKNRPQTSEAEQILDDDDVTTMIPVDENTSANNELSIVNNRVPVHERLGPMNTNRRIRPNMPRSGNQPRFNNPRSNFPRFNPPRFNAPGSNVQPNSTFLGNTWMRNQRS